MEISCIPNPVFAAEHDRDLAEAKNRGIFGVPTFSVGGRMFWGNDRLPLVRTVLEGRI